MLRIVLKKCSYFLFVLCIWGYYYLPHSKVVFERLYDPCTYLYYCLITMVLFWFYLIVTNKSFFTEENEFEEFSLSYICMYLIVMFLTFIDNDIKSNGISFYLSNGIFNIISTSFISFIQIIYIHFCISYICLLLIVIFFNALYKAVYRR